MTLLDLFAAIDWEGTDDALSAWKTENPDADATLPADEFHDRWRQVLLVYALPQDIVGEQPDWSSERAQAARWALNAAGVWTQVIAWLASHGYLTTDVDISVSSQLDLFAKDSTDGVLS